TTVPRLSLTTGGRVVVPVLAERQGYAGKIDLTSGLPPGVMVSGADIPEGADGTLLSLERSTAGFYAVLTKWRGKAADGTEQVAVVKGHPLEDVQPWLATEFVVAASDAKASDLAIDWRDLAADTVLVPGAKLKLPVKVSRTDDKTTVKLTLLTSQVTPL